MTNLNRVAMWWGSYDATRCSSLVIGADTIHIVEKELGFVLQNPA